MIAFDSVADMAAHEIARGDTQEAYENSGYVAVVKGNFAGLAKFGHCSCYGTWTSVLGGGVSRSGKPVEQVEWDWSGSPDDLVRLAARRADPHFPDTPADEKDYDYGCLVECYAAIIRWDRTRVRPVNTPESESI